MTDTSSPRDAYVYRSEISMHKQVERGRRIRMRISDLELRFEQNLPSKSWMMDSNGGNMGRRMSRTVHIPGTTIGAQVEDAL
ncbi:hypothetical protein Sjap_018633 [Stephania japonica]|uniref:Uncharacterized protein n=1 Tax=Stephania japonica TaxID=461633 RepID=A0AAP0NKR5_9MAGN